MKIRTPGLAGRLALVISLLVTLAVAAVWASGVRSLRRLAANEALTRVELAVSAARETMRQSTEDLLTAARVLGERPTLKRLLEVSSPDELAQYLTRYCSGAALDGCAVVRDGAASATAGDDVDWRRLIAAASEQGETFMVAGAVRDVVLGGAAAPVTGRDGATVITVRRMDERFAAGLSERAGLEIRIIDYGSFHPGEGAFAVLNSDALSRGRPVSALVDAAQAYASSAPVATASGETVALLQSLLPAEEVMDPVDTMTRRMLVVAIVIALAATASGILIGRQWISGVYRLTDAARRIGAGDLSASIPVEGGKELAVLAGTMEEMRRNLIGLTNELRRREAEARAVLGGIVEGVYAVDDARRIRFLNPQAERLLRMSAEDTVGRFCGDVLKPAPDEKGRRPCEVSCPIVRARRTGSAEAIEQIEPVPGRRRRVVIASAMPSDGIQVQVLRDETELEAVRRTRDAVLANISHEFRTPLAAQLASIELLRDGLDTMLPDEQRQLVATLERGVQRLTWLIDNLLESVRIESGQLAIRRQETTVGEVVEAALELIGPLMGQRGQTLEIAELGGLPTVRGDRQRLTQVVVNLLANASKFGPPDSTIRIGGRPSGAGGVTFWIDDEGGGPEAADDDGLFERFRRSGGEDPDESGLGLGLYIVRSIVERHGGRVWLTRTPESRTRVQVELPKDREG